MGSSEKTLALPEQKLLARERALAMAESRSMAHLSRGSRPKNGRGTQLSEVPASTVGERETERETDRGREMAKTQSPTRWAKECARVDEGWGLWSVFGSVGARMVAGGSRKARRTGQDHPCVRAAAVCAK